MIHVGGLSASDVWKIKVFAKEWRRKHGVGSGKLTRNESERSRELAQRIRRELGPCSVQVLGGVGALESALEATGAVQPAEGALPELLVVVDPEWVTLPQQLADRVLLVCSEETMLAACAKQLAQQGLYRDFRGRAGAVPYRRLCFAARTPRMQPAAGRI